MKLVIALFASVGASRSAVLRPQGAVNLLRLRGGAQEPSDTLLQATFACNKLHTTVLAEAQSGVAALRKAISTGEAVPAFGEKSDALLADAVAKFSAEMPEGDAEVTGLYKDKAEELSEVVTMGLEPLFTAQISLRVV